MLRRIIPNMYRYIVQFPTKYKKERLKEQRKQYTVPILQVKQLKSTEIKIKIKMKSNLGVIANKKKKKLNDYS